MGHWIGLVCAVLGTALLTRWWCASQHGKAVAALEAKHRVTEWIHETARAYLSNEVTHMQWRLKQLLCGSPAQEQVLVPLAFTRKHVVALASTHGWGNPTLVTGMDPSDECGEVTMAGKKAGHMLKSLDVSHAKVQAQVNAENSARRYCVTYCHPDGYMEHPEPSFHFAGRQPRIQFHTRTSRHAMDWLISELRKVMGA